MKKLCLGIAVLLAFGMMSAVAVAEKRPVNGEHYNLNIIGVKSEKDVGSSQGHTLFVPLMTEDEYDIDHPMKDKINEKPGVVIWMDQGDDFEVTDRDGTDGEARFTLGPGYYNVFARALGKPGGWVEINAGGIFHDALGDELIWLGAVTLDDRKNPGKPVSVNINELFYVDVTLCAQVDPNDPTKCVKVIEYEDYWVFDIDERPDYDVYLEDYLWKYDNNGCKLLQVRFYPCELERDNPETDIPCIDADGNPIDPKRSEKVISSAPSLPKISNVTTTWGDIKQ